MAIKCVAAIVDAAPGNQAGHILVKVQGSISEIHEGFTTGYMWADIDTAIHTTKGQIVNEVERQARDWFNANCGNPLSANDFFLFE